MRLEIDEKNAKALVTELWQHITTTGFGSQSKNDFYDYVLYLFDKHDKNRFLLDNSVYDNSQLLKVTNQKIKNTIENINLKYRGKDKKEIPMQFLKSIAGGKIKPETTDKTYTIVLENKSVRAFLDNILKTEEGITFDCQLNDEKITLKMENFYKLCKKVIEIVCKDQNVDIGEIKKAIQKQEIASENAKVRDALFSGGCKVAEILNVPGKEIAHIVSAVYGNIMTRRKLAKKDGA